MKVIAESAFNHNGSLDYLKELAYISKKSRADFFTVQVMNVDSFCTKDYSKHGLYKDTEFTPQEWNNLFDYCKEIEIDVIPCVLEEESFKNCYDYGFRLIKIHATDITNEPFLKLIATKHDIKVILETQCATIFEVKYALNILGEEKIEALFSGFSNYPTEIEDLNLNVLDSFKNNFNHKLGYADHSLDVANTPLMLLAKGCDYIEKHITISRNNRNFDYQVSLYPHEFASMVSTIKHYTLALGNGIKHPGKNEDKYRNIMYKKVVKGEITLKRADDGKYHIDNYIKEFYKKNVVVALIARLKSQRLKQKVLKPFHTDELIIDLFNRLSKSDKTKVVLATSNLPEDLPLVNLFEDKKFNVFKGDAVSVIDRMLDLAFQEKAGCIFRVTGDNPFTDPYLMDEMINLLVDNDLDYVKVNNAPFGVGAELFSTSYLWSLYVKLDTTEFSEYLTWYVLKDKDIRIGSIDIETKKPSDLVNLSIDLEEDYDRSLKLLKKINKPNFNDITLNDIILNLEGIEKVDTSKYIKLPNGNQVLLKDYLEEFENKEYTKRKKIII